ncbi:MAG TPA: class I SAM-dependent methyltransferase [Armatimonadota bacterium]|jgi:ubiquinone/menaquinone biosynthesis C-methylase UbiE
MESQFVAIADVYDELMSTIPYRAWVAYVRELAERRGHAMHRVLDVGCGTGTVSLLLARQGCEVVGFDVSAEMIQRARSKDAQGLPVRFEVQGMQRLDLPERFDTAISLFDTVNYVTEPEDLREAFKRVRRHMDPGGLFIFDMNTPYALEMEMFTQDNLRDKGEPKYVWRSHYNWRTRLAEVDMSFYVKQKNTRITLKETHRQRAYTVEEVTLWLREAGFGAEEIFEAFTRNPPNSRTDRAYVVVEALA